MYIFTCICMYVHINVCVCMYTCMLIRVCLSTYVMILCMANEASTTVLEICIYIYMYI